MGRTALPAWAAPGPTKPEVRAILLRKLDLRSDDHVVDIGAGTGAVTIEAAQIAERVTAIERDPDRVETIQANLDASRFGGTVQVRNALASDGLPDTADAVFVGGTRNLDSVLDWVHATGPRTVVLNAARLETAVAAIEGFQDRGFDPEVRSITIGCGTDLAGETAIEPERPVIMIRGEPAGAV